MILENPKCNRVEFARYVSLENFSLFCAQGVNYRRPSFKSVYLSHSPSIRSLGTALNSVCGVRLFIFNFSCKLLSFTETRNHT